MDLLRGVYRSLTYMETPQSPDGTHVKVPTSYEKVSHPAFVQYNYASFSVSVTL